MQLEAARAFTPGSDVPAKTASLLLANWKVLHAQDLCCLLERCSDTSDAADGPNAFGCPVLTCRVRVDWLCSRLQAWLDCHMAAASLVGAATGDGRSCTMRVVNMACLEPAAEAAT